MLLFVTDFSFLQLVIFFVKKNKHKSIWGPSELHPYCSHHVVFPQADEIDASTQVCVDAAQLITLMRVLVGSKMLASWPSSKRIHWMLNTCRANNKMPFNRSKENTVFNTETNKHTHQTQLSPLVRLKESIRNALVLHYIYCSVCHFYDTMLPQSFS